jgi:hypothetical protein
MPLPQTHFKWEKTESAIISPDGDKNGTLLILCSPGRIWEMKNEEWSETRLRV